MNVMEVDSKAVVRGLFIKVIRVTGIPLALLDVRNKDVLNDPQSLPDPQASFATFMRPQRLILHWGYDMEPSKLKPSTVKLLKQRQFNDHESIDENQKEVADTVTSFHLKGFRKQQCMEKEEWGKKVVWSSDQIEFGPITGLEFTDQTFNDKVTIDLNFGQTVSSLSNNLFALEYQE